MTWARRFRAWLLQDVGYAAPAPEPAPRAMKIAPVTLQEARATGIEPGRPWVIPPAFGTKAHEGAQLAMDRVPGGMSELYAGGAFGGAFSEGLGFLGYPYLAELSQRPEYRHVVTIYAFECVRKWVKFHGDDEERIDKLQKAMDRFKVKDRIREAIEHDGFFGRAQIFIDTGNNSDAELMTPLMVRKEKIAKNGLKNLKNIEPLWSYPGLYESSRPLSPTFYRPQNWQVQSQRVHSSRMLTFVGREMPDILKPAYAFGGLSLSQMIKPYVDNWLRARQSVSDLLHSFSTMVLKTNMSTILSGINDNNIMMRAEMFNLFRDNRGLMMLDKDTEELDNVSTPLGTLDKLQAQAQEQIASISGIPLVILLGVTPSGLNASSDGEIKTFYDKVKGYQERVIREPLQTIVDIIQLNEFGDLDESMTFEFETLWETDETAAAAIRKSDADADVGYINAGVVSPDEVRERIANDEQSPWFGMDLSAPAPELPDDGAELDGLKGAEDEWREGDHPRDEGGRFGSGGGGGAKAPDKPPVDAPHDPAGAKPGGQHKPVHPRIEGLLGDAGIAELRSLIADKGSTAAQIAAALAPVQAAVQSAAPTIAPGTLPDASFWAGRTYTTGNAAQTRAHLIDVAKAYASDKGGVGLKHEAKARIMIGPPAAGKSTSAEEVARRGGYAIADGDDAKKVIPEFDDGVGASAVHDESSLMGEETLAGLMSERANVILPLVGGSAASIRRRIAILQKAGYSVTVDLVDVNPDEAARRRAARTLSKGRHIDSDYANSIGNGPVQTYETLKSELPDVGFGRIDGNGPPRSERYVDAANHPDATAGKSIF